MDHSAPITLNANQGTRRAIKRCPPMRAVAKPSKPKLAPRSQKWPLGHRRGTMPRCATATVPTASHTPQAPISTTEDANSASAALHASPCAALRPRSSLLTYIIKYSGQCDKYSSCTVLHITHTPVERLAGLGVWLWPWAAPNDTLIPYTVLAIYHIGVTVILWHRFSRL